MSLYTFIITQGYKKREIAFFKKHPDMLKPYHKAISMLEKNPYYPALRLHPLRGKLKGLYSISINMKYRVTLELLIQNQEIILIDIGSHDEVYH